MPRAAMGPSAVPEAACPPWQGRCGKTHEQPLRGPSPPRRRAPSVLAPACARTRSVGWGRAKAALLLLFCTLRQAAGRLLQPQPRFLPLARSGKSESPDAGSRGWK